MISLGIEKSSGFRVDRRCFLIKLRFISLFPAVISIAFAPRRTKSFTSYVPGTPLCVCVYTLERMSVVSLRNSRRPAVLRLFKLSRVAPTRVLRIIYG